MSTKNFCDICNKECSPGGRYELVYKSILRQNKQDICFECIERIKKEIEKRRIKQNGYL